MSEIKSGRLSTAVHLLGLGVRLGFILALVSYSSPTVIGLFGLISAIEIVTIYLAGFEFHTFVARRHARRPCLPRLKLLWCCHFRIVIPSVLVAPGVAWVGAELLGVGLSPSGVVLLATVVMSGTLLQEQGRYLVLMHKAERSVALHFMRTAAWQPLAIPFLTPDESTITSILWCWAAFALLGTMWGLWEVRSLISWSIKPRAKYLLAGLAEARGYYGLAVLTVTQGNVERFALQLLLGTTAVGIFTFYQSIANTLSSIIQVAIGNITYPRLLVAFGQVKPERVQYLLQVVRRVLSTAIALAVAILVATLLLMRLLPNSDFLSAGWLLPLLLLGQVLLVLSQPIHVALFAARDDRFLISLMIVAIAISISSNYVLISTSGLLGAGLVPVLVATVLGVARWKRLRVHSRQGGA
jgi:O-antigen/teichoic acid export membrane protein